jgi:hypothetical protein
MVLSGFDRATAQEGSRGILGYLDSKTGAFHPVDSNAPPSANLTTVAGTIVVNFKLTIKSTLAKKGKITCGVTANVEDLVVKPFFVAFDSETATSKVTGNSCTVTIPYAFHLANPTGDTLSLSAFLQSTGLPGRISQQYLDTISPVPTGQTPEELDVTL